MQIKRDVVLIALSVLSTLSVVSVAQQAKDLLRSAIYPWESKSFEASKTGGEQRFLHGPTTTLKDLDVHLTIVNPGITLESPPPRVKEELVILKEGTVEVRMQGEWKSMSPGSVLFNAAYQTHGLRNTGSAPASYYLVTWVPR